MKFAERGGIYYPIEVISGGMGMYTVKFKDNTTAIIPVIENYFPPFNVGKKVDWVDTPIDNTNNSDKNNGTIQSIEYYRKDFEKWVFTVEWPQYSLSGSKQITTEAGANLRAHFTGPKKYLVGELLDVASDMVIERNCTLLGYAYWNADKGWWIKVEFATGAGGTWESRVWRAGEKPPQWVVDQPDMKVNLVYKGENFYMTQGEKVRGGVPTRLKKINDIGYKADMLLDLDVSHAEDIYDEIELTDVNPIDRPPNDVGLRNRFQGRGSEYPDWQNDVLDETQAAQFAEEAEEIGLMSAEAVGGVAVSAGVAQTVASLAPALAVGIGTIVVAAAVAGAIYWIVDLANEQERLQINDDTEQQLMNTLKNKPIFLYCTIADDPSQRDKWWRGKIINVIWGVGPVKTALVVEVTCNNQRKYQVISTNLMNQHFAKLGPPLTMRKNSYMYDKETRALLGGTLDVRHYDEFDNLIRDFEKRGDPKFHVGSSVEWNGKVWNVESYTWQQGRYIATITRYDDQNVSATVPMADLKIHIEPTFEPTDKVQIIGDPSGKIFTVTGTTAGRVEMVDDDGHITVLNQDELKGYLVPEADMWIFRCVRKAPALKKVDLYWTNPNGIERKVDFSVVLKINNVG